MKRYALFTGRFVLVPMISGTFVVSQSRPASLIEWAHVITGFATIYLILGLLLFSFSSRQHARLRLPAAVALALVLLEGIPGVPRLHALVSPLLFAILAWAATALFPEPQPTPARSRWIFALPTLVLLAIFYGVGYRHQTSGVLSHLGAALSAAGILLGYCVYLNDRYPADRKLRTVSSLTIAAIIFQVVFGIVAYIVSLLEINGGLILSVARAAHITGAGLVLAASVELAIQFRRTAGIPASQVLDAVEVPKAVA
jgi:heme A synthase